MTVIRQLTRHWGHALSAFIAAGLSAYFGYHLVTGERGAVVLWDLRLEESRLENKLAQLRAERETLAHHVDLMRPEHGDPDLIEERVRRELGFARKDDLIIFRK
ncbi:MAG: FtsB family cell division protein [Alphaproteobacteria bacterium]